MNNPYGFGQTLHWSLGSLLMREVKELVPVLAAPVISTVTQLRYGEQL